MRLTRPSLVLLVCWAVPTAAHADFGVKDPARLVDPIFARWSRDTPGCAVGVSRGGREVLRRAYGVSDLEHGTPNTTETIFEAGSVSKQFTAAAILLLAQAGKLSLDDPVRHYIPELPDYGVPLTIEHMLHHTSGLRDWGTVVEAAGWPRGSRVHTHAHVLDIVARQKALNFPPGTEYLYSNTGYNLLAIIVDRVSGKPFAQFTREAIFEPLGMTRTQWRDDYTRVVRGRAISYAREADGYHTDMPFENVHGNGGLLTTVGDLLRWDANFGDARVGGRTLVDALQRRGRLTGGQEIAYARGLTVSRYRGVPEVSHSGATAGYRAFLARYPDQGLSVAVLCNAADAKPTDYAREVAAAFLGTTLADPDKPLAGGLPEAALRLRAGTFRNPRTGEALRVGVRGGKLIVDDAEGTELAPLGPRLFAVGKGSSRVQFDTDARPRILEFVTADGLRTRYEAVEEVHPGPAELAEYQGTYTSEEAEATYVVSVENGRLVAQRRPDVRLVLEPAYRDGFTHRRLGLVLFRRDERGRVNGLSLGLGRVRDLRFAKLDASARR